MPGKSKRGNGEGGVRVAVVMSMDDRPGELSKVGACQPFFPLGRFFSTTHRIYDSLVLLGRNKLGKTLFFFHGKTGWTEGCGLVRVALVAWWHMPSFSGDSQSQPFFFPLSLSATVVISVRTPS